MMRRKLAIDKTEIINTGSGYSLAAGYHENGLLYDKNGNIMSLQRTGATAVFDNLSYVYSGNQLQRVTDAVTNQQTEGFIDGNTSGNDYTYDVNGNMKTDKNKGITSITYNHLNLPKKITFNKGNQHGYSSIEYMYDATGVKQRKLVVEYLGTNSMTSEMLYYAGGYVYKSTGSYTHNGTFWVGSSLDHGLQFFPHAEGYVEPVGGGGNFEYVYQYKDHLGNIRLSYKDVSTTSTPLLEILEENNYYPFGLKHKGYNNVISGTDHKYGFGGKEEQDELGLGWLDITARNYDPALGRWMNIDPLAEMMRSQSTYNYAFNNPVNLIDEDGKAPSKPDDIITTINNVRTATDDVVRRDVNIHMTVTVVNLSGADLSETMFKGGSGTIRLKNFEGRGEQYIPGAPAIQDNIQSFTVDFKVVTSLDNIREGDHAMLIVDKIEGEDKADDIWGLSGGGVSAVEAETIGLGQFDTVAQHEIGHEVGAGHRHESNDVLMKEKGAGNKNNVHKLSKGEMIWNQIDKKTEKGTYKLTDPNSGWIGNASTRKKQALKFIKDNNIKY